jgi:hypothetical protein
VDILNESTGKEHIYGIEQNEFYKLHSKKNDAWEEIDELLSCEAPDTTKEMRFTVDIVQA